jgi:ATP-dependent Clp protease protease subunit
VSAFFLLLTFFLLQFLPSVTELVVAQCYYLDFDDKNRQKPIYVYLNSTGCINEKGQAVSADNEFYAIWAALGFTRAPLYTGGVQGCASGSGFYGSSSGLSH